MIALYDNNDCIRYANTAFRKAFFVDPDETLTWHDMMRRNHALGRGTILNTTDFDGWLSSVKSRRGKESERLFEMDLHDGRWFWASETVHPNGWMLFNAIEITQMHISERALRQDRDFALKASQTDDLTGISNRRHIMDMLRQHLAGETASRSRKGCACLLDIDHFKRINDVYGHQAGDDVLERFARNLRDTVRLADGVGRIGGEEFLVIMPDVTVAEATGIVDRIFHALETLQVLPEKPDHRITISAGLTEIAAGDTADGIFRRSDEALYRAKQNGRNQLCIHGT